MNKQELQRKLRATYNRETWKEVLLEMFPEADIFAQDRQTIFTREEQRNLANHIAQFGEVDLDGDTLIFLEVELKPESVHITRNRVGLRKLVDNEVVAGLTDGALISYYQPETNEWRITFYSERYGWDEDGNTIKEETHPKRYTYVVGPDEPCKTAAGQLIKVVDEGSDNTLEHVLKAFSVQKVSKEFFKEYKEQYDKFVGHLTGKIWTKSGVKEVGDRISQFQFYFKATTDHEKEARDFVKKLLGRIVFLYFVQKKQWLGASSTEFNDGQPDFIYDLFKQVQDDQKDQFYSHWLTKLFFDTLNRDDDHAFTMPDDSTLYIPFLNGGLFERDETDHKTETLPLPGKLFSNPDDTESPNKRGFLDFLSAYNFTIHEDSPGDHTIAVDPEMLGHIFENLLEDNKDKGAYYTPKPIVHYMCQESLIEYLLTELVVEGTDESEKEKLRGHLEDLIKKQEAGELVGFTEEILKSLKDVKVCDPAIGSGAFPMGILQEIYQAVETLHHLSPDNVKAIWELPDDDWHPAEVKKQIIQNSIYGVDIEKGAVDIARLRFWLSLIVDEEEPTALPNLDYKIVVGDSLVSKFEGELLEIEWDLEDSQSNMFGHEEFLKRQKLLKDITKTQKQYFKAGSDKKEELALKVRNQKIDLLINQLSLMIQTKGEEKKPTGSGKKINERMNRWVDTQKWKRLIQTLKGLRENPEKPFQHFDWKLDFPEILNEQFEDNTGFDVIIANPPYVKEYTHKAAFDGFRDSPYYEGKMDLWYGFACISIDMLKENGIECFIAQNNWVTSSGASKMRKKVLKDSKILKLVDFGSYEIFDNASIQTMVMLFQKDDKTDDYRAGISRIEKPNAEFTDVVSLLSEKDYDGLRYLEPKINREFLEGEYLTFSNAKVSDILIKIAKCKNFSFHRNEVGQGIVAPQDFVNNNHVEELGSSVSKGQGIFNLSKGEKEAVNLNEQEEELIKPFYTSGELHRYFGEQENNYWVIYTDSSFGSKFSGSKKNPPADLSKYPNIVAHLDQFKGVITSDWKPYGLHRARDEKFFTGKKIISLRKCSDRPTFTYTDFPCYVSQTYFVIKPENIDLKYLTGLLNSKLIMFWLKHKGKMQGNNFQVDKAPIMKIPIHKPESDPGLADLVDIILTQKEANSEADTTDLEQQIDLLVYKLYNLTWEEVKVVDPEFGLSEEEYEAVEVD